MCACRIHISLSAHIFEFHNKISQRISSILSFCFVLLFRKKRKEKLLLQTSTKKKRERERETKQYTYSNKKRTRAKRKNQHRDIQRHTSKIKLLD